jgi:hypothetical protein
MAFPSKGRVRTLDGAGFAGLGSVDGTEAELVVGMTAIELSAVSAVVARTFTDLPMRPIWIWRGGLPFFLVAVEVAVARLARLSFLATIVL